MLTKKYVVQYSCSSDYEIIVEAVSEPHAKEIFHAIISQDIEETHADMDFNDVKINNIQQLS